MSIAAPELKLLRIVFQPFMYFFGSQIQKKFFPGGRCVIDTLMIIKWCLTLAPHHKMETQFSEIPPFFEPRKYFFFGFETQKETRRLENNSKQYLLWCCYTNFHSFARKTQLRTRVVGHKFVIRGQTNKNEDSSTRAKIAYNCFSNLHVFFRVSNPKKKVFSRGPVCH